MKAAPSTPPEGELLSSSAFKPSFRGRVREGLEGAGGAVGSEERRIHLVRTVRADEYSPVGVK